MSTILYIIAFILFLITGFLSASNKAISVVHRNDINKLREEKEAGAENVFKLFSKLSDFNTLYESFVIFSFSVISFILNYQFVSSRTIYISEIKNIIGDIILMNIAIFLIFFFFGIFYPKKLAVQHEVGLSLKLAKPTRIFIKILKPVTVCYNAIVKGLLFITRQKTEDINEEFSEEDVLSMLEAGKDSGELKEEGKNMISSIFEFDDKLAFEIMTPRTDVFLIDIDDPIDDYIDQLMELKFSRIPVYREDSDNIIGILHIKDFLIKARTDGFDKVDLNEILREPYLVPDTKNIDALFVDLQRLKQHIAILIDEYGGFSGIVTMEDIIEQVMGDIDDEYDDEEKIVEKLSDTKFKINGIADIDDVNEMLNINLKSDNSETIGGLIIDILGEIPTDNEIGKIISVDNYEFKIQKIDDKRIISVILRILPVEEE